MKDFKITEERAKLWIKQLRIEIDKVTDKEVAEYFKSSKKGIIINPK